MWWKINPVFWHENNNDNFLFYNNTKFNLEYLKVCYIMLKIAIVTRKYSFWTPGRVNEIWQVDNEQRYDVCAYFSIYTIGYQWYYACHDQLRLLMYPSLHQWFIIYKVDLTKLWWGSWSLPYSHCKDRLREP